MNPIEAFMKITHQFYFLVLVTQNLESFLFFLACIFETYKVNARGTLAGSNSGKIISSFPLSIASLTW